MEELVFGRRYRVTREDRHRWHGRRLQGSRRGAGPDRRRQGDASALRRRPLVRRPLPPRGSGGRQPRQPQHREHVRLGRRRRHLLHGHGVRPRQRPQVDHPAEGRAGLGQGRRHRRAGLRGALSVAHGYDIIHRDIKPHNIMVQPDGSREGHGLRHRPRRQHDDDADRLGARHGALRLSRAGPGQGAAGLRATCTRSASCSTKQRPGTCRSTPTRPLPSRSSRSTSSPSRRSAVNPACRSRARSRHRQGDAEEPAGSATPRPTRCAATSSPSLRAASPLPRLLAPR